MTESDLSLNLAATFGPILKKSFPDASPRWRYAVAGALAESVITRRSWFAQPVDETERLRSLSDRAAPAPWVVYSEPEVGLFASVFSGTVMQTGFAPVNLDDPANVEFIVEAVNFTRAALQHKGEVSRG